MLNHEESLPPHTHTQISGWICCHCAILMLMNVDAYLLFTTTVITVENEHGDEVVCILHRVDTLEKGLHPTILSPASVNKKAH